MKNHRSKKPNGQHKKKDAQPVADAATGATLKLRVTINGRAAKPIPIHELDEPSLVELQQEWESSTAPIDVDVTEISRWPDRFRWWAMQTSKATGNRIVFTVNGKKHEDPFVGVLAAMTGPTDDVRSHVNSIRAAQEAAAVFYPDAIPYAAALINQQLKKLSAPTVPPTKLIASIEALCGKGNDGNGQVVDARSAAAAFVQRMGEETKLQGSDVPRLIWYRSEFYHYQGKVWERVEDDRVIAQVTKFLQERNNLIVTRRLVQDVLTNLQGMTLFPLWKQDPPFYISSFNPPAATAQHWLACQNGIVDLRDVTDGDVLPLQEHQPSFFGTVLLPFDFDPAARCPKWHKFLDQQLPRLNQQDRRQLILQEFFGYTLLHDCRFEMALILLGDGRTGKSTILRTWQELLGADNVSNIPFDQIGEPFRVIELQGKAANFGTELNHMGKASESLFKQLVSGEPFSANRKFKPPISLRSFAKLVFAGNELPTISDTSEGIWRRLTIITFSNQVPKDQVNTVLAKELKEECPGILNWALEGLRRLMEQQRFTECTLCQAALNEHRTTSDSVREFILDCCVKHSAYSVHSQRLYEVYGFYCDQRRRKAVSAVEFGKRAKRRGFVKRRANAMQEESSRPWLYNGIALTPMGREWMQRYLSVQKAPWDDLHYPHHLRAIAASRPGSSELPKGSWTR